MARCWSWVSLALQVGLRRDVTARFAHRPCVEPPADQLFMDHWRVALLGEFLVDVGHLGLEIGQRQRFPAPVGVRLSEALPLGVLMQRCGAINKLPLMPRRGALDTV